ncbi:MAG: hypothetical protein NT093_01620 [Candidatus Moranbacteria bacterium]|nr:hypothetical protein [Candidatus Moranbacteria bacterium]
MKELYESGKYGECVAAIKNHFALPLRLRICYHDIQGRDPLINSVKLLCLMGELSGRTVIAANSVEVFRDLASTPASVLIDGNLPPLGTEAFENAQAQLMINKGTLKLPFYCFAYSIGHEMSHLLLGGMRYLAKSEAAADIVPLLRGFTKEVIAAKIHTGNNFGYLPTSDFLTIARGTFAERHTAGMPFLFLQIKKGQANRPVPGARSV